jgi:hypothetical protein
MAVALMMGAAVSGNTARAQFMPALPANQLRLPEKSFSISFQWKGDSSNATREPHMAILVPVKLPNCPKLFYMQFDLGSPYSLFYTNKLAAIQQKYPAAIPLKDSTGKLVNFTFTTGKTPITAKEIVVKQFDNTTINWSDRNSIEIIGTIGTDLIDGKVLIIDYPKKKLTISPAIPAKLMKRISLSDFVYARRSILLPAKVQGKQTMLFFDTGSSMYELLTDKKTVESLAIPNSPLLQRKVKSWDTYLTANSLASNDSITISSQKIPLHFATYMEGVSNSQVAQMMKLGIGGMTGNKLFLKHTLVLDTKNKKFGLVPGR